MDAPSDFSYLHTPPIKPYSYTTVAKVAKENAFHHPNKEVFILREVDGSRSSLTNAALYQQAEQLARYLVTQGIQKGDVVALVGPNTLEMVIGMLGILTAGAVVLNVTINMKTALDVKELFQLAHVKCALVDTGKDNSLLPPVRAMLQHCNVQTDETNEDSDRKFILLRKADLHDFKTAESLETIQLQNLSEVELPSIYPEDNAIIFTTSGSTGKPKMVFHSHFDFASYPLPLTPPTADYEITIFNDRPFAWIGGSPVYTILRSETRVVMDASIAMNSQNTKLIWQIVKEERCTDALMLPFVIHDLLELTKTVTEDDFRLQHIITGGQMIDNCYTGVIGPFCHKMMIVYACSEGIGITLNGPIGHAQPLLAGDVGKPYPGVEVRIVDFQELPIARGLIGKIQIRSRQVMKEYFCSPNLTKEAFTEERWFKTGDIGKISVDGNLILLGRENDAISRGTRKIYPSMLEFLLKQMKSIKEVSLVPVPDKRLYEEICVCFVSSGQLTSHDVQNYCKQNLFKENTVDSLGEIPTYFLQFETFPKLPSGKPDKKAIQKDATVRLSLMGEVVNSN
ncbi:putative acyl--CoA ligase YdaB [Ylistrum balloti]|uniref:putative acyl--CoA ligase YdaB n=1 Tax=Ylistrum balloti TaxID=509963 RepID=UPI002905E409|nr:putative acyl--CoA ligase YdaB [Ylistrum balloti]